MDGGCGLVKNKWRAISVEVSDAAFFPQKAKLKQHLRVHICRCYIQSGMEQLHETVL